MFSAAGLPTAFTLNLRAALPPPPRIDQGDFLPENQLLGDDMSEADRIACQQAYEELGHALQPDSQSAAQFGDPQVALSAAEPADDSHFHLVHADEHLERPPGDDDLVGLDSFPFESGVDGYGIPIQPQVLENRMYNRAADESPSTSPPGSPPPISSDSLLDRFEQVKQDAQTRREEFNRIMMLNERVRKSPTLETQTQLGRAIAENSHGPAEELDKI